MRQRVESDSSTLVVSNELLTNPLAPVEVNHLERIERAVRYLDPTGGHTRIVCTIRPQPDWVGSAFAFSPHELDWDFEAFVSSVTSQAGSLRLLDFDRLDHDLSRIIGTQRVSFLPLHRFGTEWWDELARGTSLDAGELMTWHLANPSRLLQRSVGHGTWVTPTPVRLRGRMAQRLQAGSQMHRVVTSRWNLPLRALSAATWRPRQQVRIDVELRKRMLETFAAGNRRLASRRGLELETSGYW